MESGDLIAKMQEVRSMTDAKGFSADRERVWEMLALIHSEISEATDAYKKGQSEEEVSEELADALIRILHLFSVLGQDPEALYRKKMEKNWERPYRYNTMRGG